MAEMMPIRARSSGKSSARARVRRGLAAIDKAAARVRARLAAVVTA